MKEGEMDEEILVQETIFADPFAERGEVIRNLAFALDEIQDEEGKAAVLKAIERLTLSISVAEVKSAVVKGLKAKDSL
jgi:hypothetical protein